MHKREARATVAGLIAIDAMMLTWAASLALGLRYGTGGWPGGSGGGSESLTFLIGGIALSLFSLAALGLYRLDDLFSGHREYAGAVRGCTSRLDFKSSATRRTRWSWRSSTARAT